MNEVLVPLDGSPLSETALPLAAKFAGHGGDALRLVYASGPYLHPLGTRPYQGELDHGAEVYLVRVADRIHRRFGTTVHSQVEYGLDVNVILRAAQEPVVSLIVMSTHGRTGIARTVLGSVAESVLRESPVPVLLFPAAASFAEGTTFRRVVVPLDGSELAHAALAPAAELARRFDAELVLLQVAPSPQYMASADGHVVRTVDQDAAALQADAERYLSAVQSELTRQGIASSMEVRFGDPAEELVREIPTLRADLIVMSTHGRTGLERIRHGSVAESVLRHSRIPVFMLGSAAISRLSKHVAAAAS